jgi:hypothetical protein
LSCAAARFSSARSPKRCRCGWPPPAGRAGDGRHLR